MAAPTLSRLASVSVVLAIACTPAATLQRAEPPPRLPAPGEAEAEVARLVHDAGDVAAKPISATQPDAVNPRVVVPAGSPRVAAWSTAREGAEWDYEQIPGGRRVRVGRVVRVYRVKSECVWIAQRFSQDEEVPGRWGAPAWIPWMPGDRGDAYGSWDCPSAPASAAPATSSP